jgi:hypothetical protein
VRRLDAEEANGFHGIIHVSIFVYEFVSTHDLPANSCKGSGHTARPTLITYIGTVVVEGWNEVRRWLGYSTEAEKSDREKASKVHFYGVDR